MSNNKKDLNELTNLLKDEKRVSNLLEDSRKGLEKTVKERAEELSVMLSNIDKAIFRVDANGKILSPVSDYSKSIFGKDISGEHALKLLFFHLKLSDKALTLKSL